MNGRVDSTCRGCIHLVCLAGAGSQTKNCNYIIDTGHPRGCPPGKGCTKRELKGEVKRIRRISISNKRKGKSGT